MTSSESFKYPKRKLKVYYHLRCKNPNCKGKGLNYNTEKIENKLKRFLDELTLFMLSQENDVNVNIKCYKNGKVKMLEYLPLIWRRYLI